MYFDWNTGALELWYSGWVTSSFFEKFDIYGHQSPEDIHCLNTTTAKWRWESARCLMMWWWSRHTVYDERWQDFQAADEFGVVNQGASVLGFAGLSCSTKEFHATALIKNGWLCLLRHAFISLFFFPSLSLSLPRFSERTQHKDVGGGKMGQGAGGVGEQKIWKRRNWNDGVMSDRRHGGSNNWIKGGTGPFLAYINVWILKVLLLMCGCGCAALHPPPLLFLLANHHTTLLYLGHSNVLLLSPLADVLCSNLWKK